jgi:hypothetical protein
LPPEQVESPYVIALPSDGTLLQLAWFTSDRLMRRQHSPEYRLVALPDGVTQVDQRFGDTLVLRGYSVRRENAPSRLGVRLYWQARAPGSKDYTVFVHLLDANGRLIAQHDSLPNGGNSPMRVWQPGQVVADDHHVDIGATPSAPLTIAVGLYDPATGVRLTLPTGQDHVLLSPLSLP